MFESDHTHCQWRRTVANVGEEAVAEELSPYKELFTTVVLQKDHGAAATSCFRVYCSSQSCYGRILLMNSNAKAIKSIAKPTKSIAKPANSIANRTNTTAKATNSTLK